MSISMSRQSNPGQASSGRSTIYIDSTTEKIHVVDDSGVERVIEGSPVGSVTAFAGSSAPTGWLMCDGDSVSETTYDALFAVIGTTYGNTGGAGTFDLPDLRGRVALGAGAGAGLTSRSLADEGGQEAITSVPAHTHTAPNNIYVGSGNTDEPEGTSSLASTQLVSLGDVFSTNAATESVSDANTGSTGAASVDTMNPFVALNYIIKYI